MNTTEITREQISLLVDGELTDAQCDAALASLRHGELRDEWDIYHHIGDVLRSDDMAMDLSSDFSACMAARLDAEPAIVAPLATKGLARHWPVRKLVAAAAVATGAFIVTPQLIMNLKGDVTIAEVTSPTGASQMAMPVSVRAASVSEGVILRDPRIDDYLLAHQRFSPSLYSTAQYARSTTFSGK